MSDRGWALSTITALATAPGRSALHLVRVSGDDAHAIVAAVALPMRPAPLAPGHPRRVRFVDAAGVFDDGVAWLAKGPATATGEDTAELTCHGNPLLAQRLLDSLVSAGARVAWPGEFTRRAVERGRIDLLAAEAVQQLVDATSMAGVELAQQGLDGRLTGEAAALREVVVEATAELEARLDMPEEALAWMDDAALAASLSSARDRARALAETWSAGRLWIGGARVALVGAVNAGKSSLFNALLGRTRALVHATPGTTRDVLEVGATFDGLAVTLLDTAGERETDDPVEAAGLALAAELVGEADLLVVVVRAGPDAPAEAERAILARAAGRPHVVVYNGVDRPHAPPAAGWLPTVALSGAGVADVAAAIRAALVGTSSPREGLVIGAARQRDCLIALAEGIDEAIVALPIAGVAVAADALQRALEAVDGLTGRDTREDVLDALFARFCVGK